MRIDEYIDRFKVKDYSCFEQFYNETSKQVYFTALGILKESTLAEDIMQETYISFLESVDRYKKGGNIYAYLTVIARNKSLNHLKKAGRIIYDDEIIKTIGYEPDTGTDGVEEILSLLENPEEREIVVYHVFLDYKFKEIAQIMKKPLGTVLWRYNKAMKTLREKVEKIYE